MCDWLDEISHQRVPHFIQYFWSSSWWIYTKSLYIFIKSTYDIIWLTMPELRICVFYSKLSIQFHISAGNRINPFNRICALIMKVTSHNFLIFYSNYYQIKLIYIVRFPAKKVGIDVCACVCFFYKTFFHLQFIVAILYKAECE